MRVAGKRALQVYETHCVICHLFLGCEIWYQLVQLILLRDAKIRPSFKTREHKPSSKSAPPRHILPSHHIGMIVRHRLFTSYKLQFERIPSGIYSDFRSC
jgi:hypothetical protein